MAQITLSSAIENLRSELTLAMKAGAHDELRFQLGTIEIELDVTVGSELDGKAGIKWWVVEANVGEKQTAGSTHRIKLKLDPQTATGQPVKVSNTDPKKPV